MLALAIISTVFISVGLIIHVGKVINSADDYGDEALAYIVGIVLGVCVRVFPIITIWVLYAHLGG